MNDNVILREYELIPFAFPPRFRQCLRAGRLSVSHTGGLDRNSLAAFGKLVEFEANVWHLRKKKTVETKKTEKICIQKPHMFTYRSTHLTNGHAATRKPHRYPRTAAHLAPQSQWHAHRHTCPADPASVAPVPVP